MLKKISTVSVTALMLMMSLTACSSENKPAEESENVSDTSAATSNESQSSTSAQLTVSVDDESDETYDNKGTAVFGETVSVTGNGITADGGKVSITAGGEYNLSGTCNDGMVYINTDEKVKLVLNGVTLTNKSGAAIYVANADKCIINLADGSENYLCDGEEYSFSGTDENADEDEPNATIYSKDDLKISGNGSLTVEGKYNNGIVAKDDLRIKSGTINITAVNNGLKGKDSIEISGGNINITSGGDAVKSTNADEEGEGYIIISDGTLTINSKEDGIQAETNLLISGGTINITTTGEVASSGGDMNGFGNKGDWNNMTLPDNAGVVNTSVTTATTETEDASSKGIKATNDIAVSGGSVTVNSTDHSIHSAGTMEITDGTIELSSSSGKGISAHGNLSISGGDINITKSTEGIESKAVMDISGGTIHILANDDGLNAGGGVSMGNWINSDTDTSTVHEIDISGGFMYINSQGDGIDSNGNIVMTGGTAIVCGPTNDGNGPLDSGDNNNTITVSGGTLIALGSTGMLEVPEANYCGTTSLSAAANETFTVTDNDGNVIASLLLPKAAQGVIMSINGTSEGYKAYTGGTYSGTYDNYGYAEGGTLTDGTEVTLSATVSGSGFGGGGFGGGGFRGNRGQ